MEDYVNRVADYLTLNPSTLRDSVTAHIQGGGRAPCHQVVFAPSSKALDE
jgi:hypothetical protein